MQLHRTTGVPDWDTIPSADRNRWQRLAQRSDGIVTPPNAVTLIGLIIVGAGLMAILQRHYWLGLSGLLIGRLADLVDGWLAQRTGTKSPLGELLDATADKIGTFATLIACLAAHVAPWWLVVALVLPHIIITCIAANASLRGNRLHPSRVGKVSMAAVWVCLLAFVLLQATHAATGLPAKIIYAVALVTAVSVFYAASLYALGRD